MKRILALCVLLAACGSVTQDADVADLAASAGMERLATTTLPTGREEIRIWIADGLVTPYHLVRLTHARDRWMGELWRYWPHGDSLDSDIDSCRCARTIRGPLYTLCRVTEEKGIDWESVARRLQEWNVRDLSAAKHGDALRVEVLNGLAYARRDVDASSSNPARIVELLESLDPAPCR